MRFVKIASTRRGAIEPAEVLGDRNQELALVRWEADQGGMGETVVWHGEHPSIAAAGTRPARAERMPVVSAELRAQLRGAPLAADEDWLRRGGSR